MHFTTANNRENFMFQWFIHISKTVHLRQLKGMQSSKQGIWKGYHFSIECKRKEYLFCQTLYLKGWGVGPRGGAPPYKTFSGTPAPGSITFNSVGEILWYHYSHKTSSAELCIVQWVYFLGFFTIFLWIFFFGGGVAVLRKYWSLL